MTLVPSKGIVPVEYPFHRKAPEADMLVWLRRLADGVANPPTDNQKFREQCELMIEVCGHFPVEVWCKESRLAWFKQPASRDGRLRGEFWPTAAGLYHHLKAFADRVPSQRRDDYETACRSWAAQGCDGAKPKPEEFGGFSHG